MPDKFGFDMLNQGMMNFGSVMAQQREKDRQQALMQQFIGGIHGTQNVPQGTPGAEWYSPDNSYRKQNDFNSPGVQEPFLQLLSQNPETAKNLMEYMQMSQPEYKQFEVPNQGRYEQATNRMNGKAVGPPNLLQAATPMDMKLMTDVSGNQVWRQRGQEQIGDTPWQKPTTTINPYSDFRKKYPQTPAGQSQAATDWVKTQSAGKSGKFSALKDSNGKITGWVSPGTGEVVKPEDIEGVTPDMIGAPTSSTTKTMMETAPKVRGLAQKIRDKVDALAGDLGPAEGRWQNFWTGQVGASNPEYNKLRVDAGLLTTALMRMHVGARGSEKIMEKFDSLVGLGHQSPENLKAAMDEIIDYANTVENHGSTQSPTTGKKFHTLKDGTKVFEEQ